MGIWDRLSRRLDELSEELLPDTLRDRVEGAQALLESGNPSGAATVLEEILAEKPDHATARYLLGAARLALGDAAAAQAAFAAAAGVRAGFGEAFAGLGEARLALGDPRGAVDAFRDVLRHAGGDRALLASAYRGLSRAYLALGDRDKALRELRKAIAEAPDDEEGAVALARALLDDPTADASEAVGPLARVVQRGQASAAAQATLGRVLLRVGRLDDAQGSLEKALASGLTGGTRVDVLVALAEIALRRGDRSGAHARWLEALAEAPERADLHLRLGDLHRDARNVEAAVAAWEAAYARGAGPEALGRAVALLLAEDRLAEATPLADRLLAERPGHPLALAARATALVARGSLDEAEALLTRVERLDAPPAARPAGLEEPREPTPELETGFSRAAEIEAHLARARLQLARGRPADAASAARVALRLDPRSPRARRLLVDARLAELAPPAPTPGPAPQAAPPVPDPSSAPDPSSSNPIAEASPGATAIPDAAPGQEARADAGRHAVARAAPDVYALAARLIAATRAAPELAVFSADAARALESYDRPLLVTIMGEFSSGKSTFVNAFLGEEIAPTGVTPTTSAIHVLKYGRRPGGRIVYLDDTARELTWDDLPRALRAVDATEARRIRHVELLYPADALARVNLVDTPGLNSILPEHETTARAFLAESDAIVWLFAAGQAGKASERDALEAVRAAGKRVLGVVNKIDQIPREEVPTVVAHLRDELADCAEDFVPVSARQAALARRTGDAAALVSSGWPALERVLEERFFGQARLLKRRACLERLRRILADARRRLVADAAAAEDRADRVHAAAARVRADAALFARAIVAEERRRLGERTAATYRAAAREVLELVRPRKLPFGTHSATPADRDYLLGLLERGLLAAIAPTEERALAELERAADEALRALAAVRLDATERDAVVRQAQGGAALVRARVFERVRAYLRGYLQGGRVDDFFSRTLPRLDLDEDSVYHALVKDAPDLEAELVAPLAQHGAAALRELADRLEQIADFADLASFELRHALVVAVDRFETATRGPIP